MIEASPRWVAPISTHGARVASSAQGGVWRSAADGDVWGSGAVARGIEKFLKSQVSLLSR